MSRCGGAAWLCSSAASNLGGTAEQARGRTAALAGAWADDDEGGLESAAAEEEEGRRGAAAGFVKKQRSRKEETDLA